MKIYIDGEYYSKEEAKISVYDHGLLYGDGIFEGIRIYGGRIFKLEEHIRRLYRSARALCLTIPLEEAEMIRTVREATALNEKEEGYIRLLVTRGVGSLGIDPTRCPRPSVIIIVEDISLYPAELYEQGIPIVTAATRRAPADVLDQRVKSLNYLNSVMGKLEARQAGCLEAVMLNKEGYVSECTADNIFLVREGELVTPAAWTGLLEGITREVILDLADREGIPRKELPLTRYDLYTAEECFLTGSGAEIIPVISVDGRTVGPGRPGELTARLRDAFAREIRRSKLD